MGGFHVPVVPAPDSCDSGVMTSLRPSLLLLLLALALALIVGCTGDLTGGDLGVPDQGVADRGPAREQPPTGDGKLDAPRDGPKPKDQNLVDKGPLDKGPVCGNGKCDGGETYKTCPKDCPAAWWQPKPGTKWHWQLKGSITTNHKVDMYDIDLFTSSTALIASLKAKGYKVICYFSAGTYEDNRPDSASFPSAAIGKKMEVWDEYWLDITNKTIWNIMAKRLDLTKSKGCDGVEPDNVDGYDNKTGFSLSGNDQLAFNKYLADEAHKRSLSVGLKNDLGQISALVSHFDWALNEECLSYNECGKMTLFITANKAVFHVEYDTTANEICSKMKQYKFDSQAKNWDLDAWYDPCW